MFSITIQNCSINIILILGALVFLMSDSMYSLTFDVLIKILRAYSVSNDVTCSATDANHFWCWRACYCYER